MSRYNTNVTPIIRNCATFVYVVLGYLSGFLCNLQQDLFDVINIIAAINSLIEFIVVMNYVKTIIYKRQVCRLE